MNYPGLHSTAVEPPDPEVVPTDEQLQEEADWQSYVEMERLGLYDEPGAQTPTEPPPVPPLEAYDDEWLRAYPRPLLHPYETTMAERYAMRHNTDTP